MIRYSNVPPVPNGIYETVQKRLKRRKNIRQTFVAVSILFICVLGITVSVRDNLQNVTTVASTQNMQAVESELQDVVKFLNGDDIEDEVDTMALTNAEKY